jgi:hypothetical protein
MHGQPLSIRELEELRAFQENNIRTLSNFEGLMGAVGLTGDVKRAWEMSDRIMRAAEELIDIRKYGKPVVEVEIEGERPSTNPKRLGQAPF